MRKFTGSADQSGRRSIHNSIPQISIILITSLKENKCPNLIFNRGASPPGEELPVEWSKNTCTPAAANTLNGSKKCRA
jgi:hypothetical protein